MSDKIQNIYNNYYSPRINTSQEDALLFRIGKSGADAASLQAQLNNINDSNSPDYQTLKEKLNQTLSEQSIARQSYQALSSKNNVNKDKTNTKQSQISFLNFSNKSNKTDNKEQIQKSNQIYNFQGKAELFNSIDYLFTGTNLDIAV